MDKNLPHLYKDYGQYSNYRNFPLDIDGLKPVERRVLLSAYKIARQKFVKSRQVDAYTIGHYHPHGECVVGDTIILLLDGRKIKIKDLVNEKTFWVYSCTEDGVIKPGLAHSVRLVKKVSKLYKIYLNNDKYEITTEDHPWQMRNGNYIEAHQLKVGDSLMPLKLRMEDGYTFYKDNSRTICREEKVSWMVVRNLIDKNIDSKIGRTKYHVHHKNNIRCCDIPDNLDLIYYKDHASETAKNMSQSSRDLIGMGVKKAYLENKNNFKEKALKGLEKGRFRMFSEDSPLREKIKQKNSKLMNNYNKRYVEDRILKILNKMIFDKIIITKDTYEQYRKQIYNGPLWKTIFKKFNTIEEAIENAKDYNHKVQKIKIINLDEPVDVYDVSVEKYHNFATSSGVFIHNCYGTVVQLVRQGFLIGQGNFGTNVGVEPVGPAAPRYTECKIHQKTIDMAFKYINHAPIVETELGDNESLFLPTMFPICLMGNEYTQGIGFGFKTFIPCFETNDLYQRLLWLLGIRKRKPIIAPMTDCVITSPPNVVEGLLTTGKAKIEVDGIIEENTRNNTITLKSWPPGKRFESMLNKFSAELDSGMIGFTDLSVDKTKIVFQVLRERNRDKIYQDFLVKIKDAVKGAISFETTVVDINHKVLVKPIDKMLLDTYNMFTEMNEIMLKHEISKVNEKIKEYNTLELIRDPLSDCIQKKLNIPTTINIITKKTGVSKTNILELINKYKISKLMTLNTDTTELINKLNVFTLNLKNLTDFVLDQYKEI